VDALGQPFKIDQVAIYPPAGSSVLMTSTNISPVALCSGNANTTTQKTWGCFSPSHELNSDNWSVTITATTGATLSSSDWRVEVCGWSSTGTAYCAQPSGGVGPTTGSKLLTVTNYPAPTPPDSNYQYDGPISGSVSGTGLDNPTLVRGFLQAGPIDSLLSLPITLLSDIVSSTDLGLTHSFAPTFTLFGYTGTVWAGHDMYDALGDTFTNLVSGALVFFIMLAWVKSLYARLQRATSLDTEESDTWGVL